VPGNDRHPIPRPILNAAVGYYALALAARKENVQAAEGQHRPDAARNAVGCSRVVYTTWHKKIETFSTFSAWLGSFVLRALHDLLTFS